MWTLLWRCNFVDSTKNPNSLLRLALSALSSLLFQKIVSVSYCILLSLSLHGAAQIKSSYVIIESTRIITPFGEAEQTENISPTASLGSSQPDQRPTDQHHYMEWNRISVKAKKNGFNSETKWLWNSPNLKIMQKSWIYSVVQSMRFYSCGFRKIWFS